MRSLGVRILFIMCFSIVAAVFAVQNGAETVQLRIGILTLRSVSLPVVVFGAVILGMLLVLLAGLRADLRTRRMLRRYQDALRGSTPEEP